jgi:hypothetical protein
MSNFNSFSGQPLVRLAPNRGQSPVSQGIDAGLSALDLAVEQGNQMQAQQFAGVMQALGGAVDVVQTVGNQQLRAATLEEQQRERALAQRIAAENEAERQRMRDRDEQVDAQREQDRISRQLEIADKAVVRKAWNASRVELERQIAMNDPRIIDAVGLQGEELATWSRDYASAFAAGVGDQANVADDLDEIAAQVASVLTRKQIEVVRSGEEQLFIDTAQVLAAQANPQDFADAADVVVGSASMHTRQEAFAKTVIPALREDAEAGRIDLLNQKMQAIGMDNDPAYGVTVQELRTKAQSAQASLQQRTIAAQREGVFNAINTGDFASAKTMAQAIGGEEQNQLMRTIRIQEEDVLKRADEQARVTAINASMQAAVADALSPVGLQIADDVPVTYASSQGPQQVSINADEYRSTVVRAAISQVQQAGTAAGRSVEDVRRDMFGVAARNNYVLPEVKQSFETLRATVSEAVNKGGPIPTQLATEAFANYRAMTPAYRERSLSENAKAFMGRVDELSQLPGMTMETAFRDAGRIESIGLETRRATEQFIAKETDKEVRARKIANKLENATWLSRRATLYALLGTDATKAMQRAKDEHDAISGNVNGYTVLYAKQFAPDASNRPFDEALGDYLRTRVFPGIQQEKPTFAGEEITIDQLVPVIDPNTETVQLRYADGMMPIFGDSRDTFPIRDVYRFFGNRQAVQDAMDTQQRTAETIAEQDANQRQREQRARQNIDTTRRSLNVTTTDNRDRITTTP